MLRLARPTATPFAALTKRALATSAVLAQVRRPFHRSHAQLTPTPTAAAQENAAL